MGNFGSKGGLRRMAPLKGASACVSSQKQQPGTPATDQPTKTTISGKAS